MRDIKKEKSRRSRNRTGICMSEVLTLAVQALVPLRHKVANGCLVKFPGLRCELVLYVLIDVVVRGESFVPQRLFLGDLKWRNRRERGMDCMEGDRIGRLTHASASF